MQLATYVDLFRLGRGNGTPVTKLAGRVLRGKSAADFETFTDDAERRLVLIVGPDSLEEFFGMAGYEMLMAIGYLPEYAKEKIEGGFDFKLVVLEEGPSAPPATWDNMLKMVGEVYPELAEDAQRHGPGLKTTKLEAFNDEFKKQHGATFLEVEKLGKSDDRFMTFDRYLASPRTLLDFRAFLYYSVHLRELYRGDGYLDHNGKKGKMEYVVKNGPIADAGPHVILDLEMQLPGTGPFIRPGRNTPRMYNTLSFLDEDRVGEGERFIPNIALARAEGRKARLSPAHKQIAAGDGCLLILIDEEIDFGDDGRLPVPGTFADLRRLIKRGYRGIMEEKYTGVIATIDCHPPHTIHSDSWWVDDQGNPPDVSIPLQMKLVDPASRFPFEALYPDGTPTGKFYRPTTMRQHTVEDYAPHLQATGQGNIWVFADHCHQGTDGVTLFPALAEFLAFASTARLIEPMFMYKGFIPQVDWFGPFRPCMDVPGHPQGGLQTQYLDQIRPNRRTEFAGQAKDFCVKAGMLQALEYYGNDQKVLESIYFLGDCTSPIVPDNPAEDYTPNADFLAKMQSKGVQIITHDAPFN